MATKKRRYAKSYNYESILYDELNQTSYSQRLKLQIRRKKRNRILIGLAAMLLAGTMATGTAYHFKQDNLRESEKNQNKIEPVGNTSLLKNTDQTDQYQLMNQEEILPAREADNTNPMSVVLDMAKVSAAEVTKESGSSKKKQEKEEVRSQVEKSPKVKMDYFSDAVFLGDSRTEGLIISTGLSKVAFYGGKGLSVDTAFTQKIVRLSGSKSKITTINALKKKKFKKVYVMFGVNELGWPYDDVFIEKYTKLIKEIKKLQPDAKIYVQSILPVSKEKETKDKIYNNKKIRRYNKLIKSMAEDQNVYYLDVASDIVNKDNVLPKAASTDGVHLNKEYCGKWLSYLRTHTVK